MRAAFDMVWNVLKRQPNPPHHKHGQKDILYDMMMELDRMLRFNEGMAPEEAALLVAQQHPEISGHIHATLPGRKTTLGVKGLADLLMGYYREHGGDPW
tara:strand:- start:142 stop:438 length:297 start_codon:yes stop_codon:yes gene_type:complete